jgi:hypothetical protein
MHPSVFGLNAVFRNGDEHCAIGDRIESERHRLRQDRTPTKQINVGIWKVLF